jgi:hypothetical protein
MKLNYLISTFLLLSISSLTFSNQLYNHTNDSDEIENVKQVIIESYVKGIFLEGNHKMVKKGWHPDCDIVILEKGKLVKLPAQYWVDRLKKNPQPMDPNVTYKFVDVKVTGYAAIAIIEIYSKGKPVYMDYMFLYQFNETWKIVTKIFYTYPKSIN